MKLDLQLTYEKRAGQMWSNRAKQTAELYKGYGKHLFGVVLVTNTRVVDISLKSWFMLSREGWFVLV